MKLTSLEGGGLETAADALPQVSISTSKQTVKRLVMSGGDCPVKRTSVRHLFGFGRIIPADWLINVR